MPALRSVPKEQTALDEQRIEDPYIAGALEARQDAKKDLAEAQKAYGAANESAKAAIGRLELPEGGAVRVGRFRITRLAVEGRHVEFDSKPTTRTNITLVDEA